MKKVSLILVALLMVAVFYNLVIAKGNAAQDSTESTYVIIRYSASYGGFVVVNYGGLKVESLEVPKEMIKSGGTTNFVIDLLNKFNTKGYTLVSTTTFNNNEVTCFLKQAK